MNNSVEKMNVDPELVKILTGIADEEDKLRHKADRVGDLALAAQVRAVAGRLHVFAGAVGAACTASEMTKAHERAVHESMVGLLVSMGLNANIEQLASPPLAG